MLKFNKYFSKINTQKALKNPNSTKSPDLNILIDLTVLLEYTFKNVKIEYPKKAHTPKENPFHPPNIG